MSKPRWFDDAWAEFYREMNTDREGVRKWDVYWDEAADVLPVDGGLAACLIRFRDQPKRIPDLLILQANGGYMLAAGEFIEKKCRTKEDKRNRDLFRALMANRTRPSMTASPAAQEASPPAEGAL